MLSIPLPSVTLARLVQPLKAELPMLVTLFGITISVNAVQLLKAASPMLVIPLPSVTLARLVQLLKAEFPILVTLSPIIKVFKFKFTPYCAVVNA